MSQLLPVLIDMFCKWNETTQFAAVTLAMACFSILFLLSGRGMLILCRGWPPPRPRARHLVNEVETMRTVLTQQNQATQRLVELVSQMVYKPNPKVPQPPVASPDATESGPRHGRTGQ